MNALFQKWPGGRYTTLSTTLNKIPKPLENNLVDKIHSIEDLNKAIIVHSNPHRIIWNIFICNRAEDQAMLKYIKEDANITRKDFEDDDEFPSPLQVNNVDADEQEDLLAFPCSLMEITNGSTGKKVTGKHSEQWNDLIVPVGESKQSSTNKMLHELVSHM